MYDSSSLSLKFIYYGSAAIRLADSRTKIAGMGRGLMILINGRGDKNHTSKTRLRPFITPANRGFAGRRPDISSIEQSGYF